MAVFIELVRRDLILAYRHRTDILNPLLFFIIVVTLFPLAISPEPETLRTIGPGLIWVAALLATLLSLEGLFRSDAEDGALEQFLLSPYPLPLLVLAKILVHWLMAGLPLLILAPLLAVTLYLSGQVMIVLIISLALGTPTLSLVGAIGAALTVSLRRGGMLLSLLVLPLYIPVLIFGASAIHSAALGLDASGQLLFLAALLALALSLAPFAIAGALRVSVSG